jgi:carbamoyl-phosphate synthase large subunit
VWNEVRLVSSPAQLLDEARHDDVALLIPTIDYEMQELVNSVGDEPLADGLPSGSSVDRVSKSRLPELANELGAQVPETSIIDSADDAEAQSTDFGGRCMVKGLVYGASEASSARHTRTLAEHLLRSQKRVIVQRRIEGDESAVTGVAWKGRLLGAITMRKLGITETGTTWCGVTTYDHALLSLAESFCIVTNWTGGFEIESIRETATQVSYLIEVNARFPSWISVGIHVQANLPGMLVQAAGGELSPARPVVGLSGWVFARQAVEVVRPISEVAQLILEGRR